MYLRHLSLTNFRNIRQLDLDLPRGPIVLAGRNGQGKTSILEAIYLLVVAKSFRAENEREVVHREAATQGYHTLVTGVFEDDGQPLRITVGYQCISSQPGSVHLPPGHDPPFQVRKQVTINRVKSAAIEVVGLTSAVLFSADDLQLVQGPPSGRRRYLDVLLSQVSRDYLRSLQRYHRVLQQRNQLLKLIGDGRAEPQEMAFWDSELVKEGSFIWMERSKALRTLGHLVQNRHQDLTREGESLVLDYRPSVPLPESPYDHTPQTLETEDAEQRFTTALAQGQGRERAVGSTLVGPHRDDFRLLLEGVDMGTYASRGQCRTLALALRLAEASYLSSQRGQGPLVLLDDVLSELDASRRERVLGMATLYPQVVISTTELDFLGPEFLGQATCFQVIDGQVAPA